MNIALKRKKQFFIILLALASAGYFSFMSGLEVHFFLKSLLSVMPLQAAAIIYVIYFYWRKK
jgi:hypothetical protein